MHVIVVGAGKVGRNLASELQQRGNELALIESDSARHAIMVDQFEHVAVLGDGSEIWVLEGAGIERADMVVAVTGDDEDNILIAQMARDKYGIERVIARCNNPRNLQHFDLLGVKPAVSATDLILRLIEHEVPRYGMHHLLDLPQENLEILELEITASSPAANRSISDLALPDGVLVISILRSGDGFVPDGESVIEPGDEVLVVLDAGLEAMITERFVPAAGRAA